MPASHYLSLTGSKFGLNAFEEEARTTRSKSPFEWWNTLKDKRRSQHLEDGDPSAEEKPRSHDIYTRRDAVHSMSSLNNQEKAVVADIYEVELSEPEPTLSRPVSRHTSFSRPFQIPVHQEPDQSDLRNLERHNRNLSMIKEASPHTSMMSSRSLERRSSRLSAYNPGEISRQERRPSVPDVDHRRPSSGSQRQRPSPPSTRRPSESSQGKHRSHSGQRRPSNHSSRQSSGRSSNSASRKRSRSGQQHLDSGMSLPYQPPQEEIPRPVAYRGSRHSLGEQDPISNNGSLSKRSSLASRHDSLTDHTELTRRPSRPKSLVLDDAVEYQQHQGPEYWAGRAEMMMPAYGDLPPQPTTPTTPPPPTSNRTPSIGRSSGKQGNVLRKKSLKRQEVVSYVGT